MFVADQVLTKIVLMPDDNANRALLADVLQKAILVNVERGLLNTVKKQQPDFVMVTQATAEQRTSLARLRDLQNRPFVLQIGTTFAPTDEIFDLTLPPELINIDLLQHLRQQQRQQSSLEARLLAQEQNRRNIEIMKSAIVRNVSHELRTPLLQVKSAVSLLAEDVDNTTLVEYATNATARLEAVVSNITQLAFSQESRDRGPVLMRECMQAALRNLGRSWEHKQNNALTRIQTSVEPNLPPVWGDRQGISTVLQLILDNALKFSEDRVELRIKRRDDCVQTTIQDYGIGIAADKLNDIFDTFYQIDNSSTRRYGGAGVGLAIARLIMEQHQTTIKVRSKEGQGSTFSFCLPIAELGE